MSIRVGIALVLSIILTGLPPTTGFAQETYSITFDPEYLEVKAGESANVMMSITGPAGVVAELHVNSTSPLTTTISPSEGEIPFSAEVSVAASSSATAGGYQITLDGIIYEESGGTVEFNTTYPVNVVEDSGDEQTSQEQLAATVSLEVTKNWNRLLEIRTQVSHVVQGQPVSITIQDGRGVQMDYFEASPSDDGSTFNSWHVTEDRYAPGVYMIIAKYGDAQDWDTFTILEDQELDFYVNIPGSETIWDTQTESRFGVGIVPLTDSEPQAVTVTCSISSSTNPDAAKGFSCKIGGSDSVELLPEQYSEVVVDFQGNNKPGVYVITMTGVSGDIVRTANRTITIMETGSPTPEVGETGEQSSGEEETLDTTQHYQYPLRTIIESMGEDVKFTSAKIENLTSQEYRFVQILQIMDTEGVTLHISWITGTISPGGSADSIVRLPPDGPIPPWITGDVEWIVKVFWWDSTDSPTPLADDEEFIGFIHFPEGPDGGMVMTGMRIP